MLSFFIFEYLDFLSDLLYYIYKGFKNRYVYYFDFEVFNNSVELPLAFVFLNFSYVNLVTSREYFQIDYKCENGTKIS